jgi:hypothetical protein
MLTSIRLLLFDSSRISWVGENPDLDLAHGKPKGVLHKGHAADRAVLGMAGLGLNTDGGDVHVQEEEVHHPGHHGHHHPQHR